MRNKRVQTANQENDFAGGIVDLLENAGKVYHRHQAYQ